MVKTCISIIFSILIVITAGQSFGIEPEFTEVEPNNTPAQANAIKLNQTVIGTFHYGDYDAGDYFTLTAPGKGRMTATVVLANPECGIMLGAMGFHSDRRDIDWVPSSSSQPAWIYSKKGESPISFSFPVQAGQKGYIVVSGPYLNQGGYSGYNWSLTACTKGGDFYLLPTANEKPKDLPATKDGKKVLPPLQYRLIVTFAGEGSVVDTDKPLATERILIEAEDETESSIRPLSERPAPNTKEINPSWRPPYSGSGVWYLAVAGEFLKYRFNINKEGLYHMWVRDYVDRFQPKGVRRIIVEFDGRPYGAFSEVDLPATGDKGAFGWHRIGNGVNLTTGTHTMKVTKEATTAGAAILDAFYLTTDPDDRPAEK